MTDRLRERTLPLRPRVLWPALLLLVVTLVVVWRAPAAYVFVGTENPAPRAIGPFEYGPASIAIASAMGLAPRFDDWDRFGHRRTRRLAVAHALATVAVPTGVAVLATSWVARDAGVSPGAGVGFWNNVMVAGLLAVALVGLLGPLTGTLLWGAGLYALLWGESLTAGPMRWSPLVLGGQADLTSAQSVRWGWLVVLGAGAVVVAWSRRSVPIRLALRSPEDR